MSQTPDFNDLFDTEGLEPEEQEQLRRVHELLVEAGPLPELTPALAKPPVVAEGAEVVRLPTRRRGAVALLLAAAVALVAFGAGYLTGNHKSTGSAAAVRVVTVSGSNATGTLRLGAKDQAGNWPIDFQVSGLPVQKEKYAYYELFLVLRGKPSLPCGGFNVGTGATNVHFDVPYKIKSSSQWVVTAVSREHHWPGRTVMT